MAKKHRPSIFRVLNHAFSEIKDRLSDEVYHADTELNHAKLEGIREMSRFIKSLSWVKSEAMRKRFDFYLKYGLNAEKTAARFEVDKDAIEASVKYYSDEKLKPIIEAPLNSLIQADRINEVEAAMMKFRRAVRRKIPNEYFLNGIPTLFPEQEYDPKITLEGCSLELTVLGTFTRSYAAFILKKGCDQSKLAYILSLLNSNKGSDQEWEALKRFFDGEFSTSESGEALSIQKQVKSMFRWLNDQNPYND